MEILDKDQGWRESDFDFVQQNLRTVLLKRKGIRHERGIVNT